ncbi:MAG: GNAT family N-acetyltransferase [Candidatus Omnitrophica bacterium]|nr:GNAT family N-acetyltransferase [Candidatus Omnitrophota bacterium]
MNLCDTKNIRGDRIYLRDIEVSDVGDHYYRWLNDPLINQFMETRFCDQSIQSIQQFVELKKYSVDELLLAICLNENDRHIGNIKIGPINQYHLTADISYFVGDKDCWGKGLATESIRLVVGYAFSTLKLHKITAGCYEPNIGSVKALQKAGFVVEGELLKQYVYNGAYINKICLGVINDKNA